MAHTLTTQVIINGQKFTVIKINIKGDSGDATEITKGVLFDASAYTTASTDNKLFEIDYCLNGFSAELFWDATTDVALISLAKDFPYKKCYADWGGYVNNSGTGKTGDILITTNGLASSTKDGYITLYILQRNYVTPLLK